MIILSSQKSVSTPITSGNLISRSHHLKFDLLLSQDEHFTDANGVINGQSLATCECRVKGSQAQEATYIKVQNN